MCMAITIKIKVEERGKNMEEKLKKFKGIICKQHVEVCGRYGQVVIVFFLEPKSLKTYYWKTNANCARFFEKEKAYNIQAFVNINDRLSYVKEI